MKGKRCKGALLNFLDFFVYDCSGLYFKFRGKFIRRNLYEIHPEIEYRREFYENGCDFNWFKFCNLSLCSIPRAAKSYRNN